jgi:hypothetical protein
MSARETIRTAAIAIVTLLLATAASAQQSEIPAASTTAAQATKAGAAFVTSLRPEQRAAVVHALDDIERTSWSNVPMYAHKRPGLRIRDLTIAQRQAMHALLRASLSSQGYEKMTGIFRLDSIHGGRELRVLEQHGPAPDDRAFAQYEAESFGSGSYSISIYGEPGRSDAWGWLVQGHHMGVSFTVSGEDAGFTPMFLGATPLVLEEGIHAGWSALSHEVTRGAELMASLSAEQRAKALEEGVVPGDALYSVGHKGSLPQPSGLRSADMTPQQRRLLRALVEEYVRNADFDVAERQLAAIDEAGWDNVWLAWRGATDDPQAALYYRVHGERIFIELAQRPNHIHTLVRDPGNDYGEHWLGATLPEPYTARDRFEAAERAYENANETR